MSKARSFWGAVFSQAVFFWAVLAVFMVVSVSQLGDFFNVAIVHGAFDGTLGYAVAAVFDLLSIVFMLARLNANRIADGRGEWLSLLGVAICAGVSAFGNVASAVQTYDVSQFNHIPSWMAQIAPYIGMAFPVMILFVTLIADHVGDLNPQRADSVEKYRLKELKKVELLKVRLEIERELAGVRLQMEALKRKPSRKQRAAMANLQPHVEVQLADLTAEVESLKMLLPPANVIAPGLSHNLPESEQKTGTDDDTMAADNRQHGSLPTGQNAGSSSAKVASDNRQHGSQNGNPITGKTATSQPTKRQSSTGQNGNQNGDQEPASKTAKRDEKIRQYAAKYPKMTHAKLATRFKVSERTIARALAAQVAAASEPQEPAELLENAAAQPSTNGHNHTTLERDTDKMANVEVGDIVTVASLN